MTGHAQQYSLAGKPIVSQAPVVLQRACACGQHTHGEGECAECKKKGQLQRKLAVGASNDPLEREADRIANQVLAAPSSAPVSGAPVSIRRFAGPAGGNAGSAPASVDRVLAEPGRPLDPALQQDMEQRFGHDFSRVRVHCGATAEQSARDVNAGAWTVGHNVAFGAGRFAPGTHEGRQLIAHELAHVVQQSSFAAAAQIQRQPEGASRPDSPDLGNVNRALRDGISVEKWSEELEHQYRARGNLARANAIRACRLEGAPACARILTSADVQFLYDRDIVPPPIAGGNITPRAPTRALGGPATAAAVMGAAAVAAPKVPLAPSGPNLPLGAAANENILAAESASAELAAAEVSAAAPPLEVAAESGAIGAGEVGAAAAPVVLPAVIAGVHWGYWKAFQDKLIANGYVLLEDPLRICIGGCHLPSAPKRPSLPDISEFGPVEPLRPFGPFTNPFPGHQLPPGWSPVKPFEAKRVSPRATPTQAPQSGPRPVPKTNPRPKDKDRCKNGKRCRDCEPHLTLPYGKSVHTELYGLEILSDRLASAPTSIQDRQRTSAYERRSKQVAKWLDAVDPEKGGSMDRKVLERGTKLLGLDRKRVLLPNWAPDGKPTQMDVDHIIELQVGWVIGYDELDTFSNYELLDASTNSSVGPTLDAAIQRERRRLKTECPWPHWDEVPLVFALPMYSGGGKGPGKRWTAADILKGKHLDAYTGRRGRRTSGP